MMNYEPPDPNKSDIVDVLEYEARYVDVAITVGDECTENYALMCKVAADEIRKLRAMTKDMLDPDMPAQQLRLHMGELTAQEVRTARAAIRWANSQVKRHHI